MKKIQILFLILSVSVTSFAQNVVKDTSNVKKPKEGGLYYQKKDKNLYLFIDKFKKVSILEDIVKPPVIINTEVVIGYWSQKDRILVKKFLPKSGNYWLMQTDAKRSFYVIRGRNMLGRDDVSLDYALDDLRNQVASGESGIAGLLIPENFPLAEWKEMGYVPGEIEGEWVKSGTEQQPSKPYELDVILSYWNGFTRDYVNCPPGVVDCNPKNYNPLVNEPSRNRYGLSLYNQKPPFWGSYHSPRTITMTDYRDGQNVTVSGTATVDFNYTQASLDKDLEYVAKAGVKAFNFFLYADNTIISEHSRFYLSSKSPYKELVQYAYTVNNLDKGMIIKIADEMKTKYYYKYNGRPVVWVNDVRGTQFSTERYILHSGAHWVVEPTGSYWKENEGYSGPVRIEPADGFVRCNGEVKRQVFVDLLKSLVPNVFLIHDHTWFYDYDKPAGFDALGAYTAPISGPNRPYTQSEHIAAHKSELENRLNAGNVVVPTITLGFQNMFPFKPAAPSIAEATVSDIENHFKMIAELGEKWGDKVPFVNVYSYSEMLECGQWALVPRINKDGSVDESKLAVLRDIIKNTIE